MIHADARPGRRPTPGRSPTKVQLFPTCLVNDFFPQVGIAAVELLERQGIRVEVPAGVVCCGQPAYNSGFHPEAKAVAGRTVELLAATDGPIVLPSGSCADMLVHQTQELFRDEPSRLAQARIVAGRCYELTQFLVDVLGVAAAVAIPVQAGAAPSLRVAYHPSCHLSRGLGVKEPPRKLLQSIPGVELVPVAEQEECCGFGGMFSVKQPAISGAMLDRKCTALEKSGATHLASCDSGCLMHLAGGLKRRGSDLTVCHVAELLNGRRA